MSRCRDLCPSRRHKGAGNRNTLWMASSFIRLSNGCRRGCAWIAGIASLFALGSTLRAQTPATVAVAAEAPPPALFVPDPNPPPETRRVLQPVLRYQNIQEPSGTGRHRIDQKVNPFLAYTHLGTDFGFIGAGEGGLGWEVGTVCISMPPGYWGGMWHSLAGLADNLDLTLDFEACYPAPIKSKYQPQVVGFEMSARGKGVLKAEIKGADQSLKWFRNFDINSTDLHTMVAPLNPKDIGKAKFLSWVAESGTDACLDSVNLVLKLPDIPFDEYVFLASYAKLARCFSPKTGFVRDRAHISDGSFDNVPATGFFALGTVLAARRGIVDENYAHDIVKQIHEAVSKLETASGLLPHFIVRQPDGKYIILAGTEYSTVDTSLYYHNMLLATQLLGDAGLREQVAAGVRNISLGGLVDSAGFLRQGLRADKVTPLPGVWRDWGGETALILTMAAMTQRPPVLGMDPSGRVFDGTGFISEIQSLFYPDFNSSRLDSVSNQNWLENRQMMLLRQREYFPLHWPGSAAAHDGFYGLSAGESRHGVGYSVGGVDLQRQTLIHPHYMLMSASLDQNPNDIYNLLRNMENEHLFPPYGMVENVTKDVDDYLPMQGALNAGFETLGSYHLLAKHRGMKDDIYEAAVMNPEFRKGAAVFYPAETSSAVAGGSRTGMPLTAR